MEIIRVDRVSKIFRKGFLAVKIPAVTDLSFAVNEHGIVGFAGPNGAGKTTTLKMIMGLVTPSSGAVRVQGLPADLPRSRKNVAYLSEQPYFYNHLTVAETLLFAGKLIAIPGSELKSRVVQSLAEVELIGLEKTRVRDLSKGMQQRLNMACALIGNPELMILDEPMSGMDPPGRSLFRSLFQALASRGVTIFFSTHVLDDIEATCTDVVVIDKGRLSYEGKVQSLLERGFLGTEFVLSHRTPEQERLLNEKWLDLRIDQETGSLFVPAGQDVREVQRWLYANGLFCDAMRRKSVSLESLLYGKENTVERSVAHRV